MAKERWDFRVDPAADETVRAAAEEAGQTLTDFVIGSALAEAERVLADRTQFTLDAEQWDALVALLDRPAQAIPELQRLLAAPSPFTDDAA